MQLIVNGENRRFDKVTTVQDLVEVLELEGRLAELKKEQFNLRFQAATGQLENTARMKAARRQAARVKTILKQKAAAAAAE